MTEGTERGAGDVVGEEHRLLVRRRARYFTLGTVGPEVAELWMVCHGYGQLARRFLRSVVPLDDGTRLIVAPEALNRFYVPDAAGMSSHQNARVGASWMTREDRLAEIEDYVEYLDAVYREAAATVSAGARLRVLGFSQATATVTRWLARGEARAERLILWGGTLPDDVDLAAAQASRRWARLTLVVGLRDEFATVAVVAAQEAKLRASGVAYDLIRYDGGHAIDAATLQALP